MDIEKSTPAGVFHLKLPDLNYFEDFLEISGICKKQLLFITIKNFKFIILKLYKILKWFIIFEYIQTYLFKIWNTFLDKISEIFTKSNESHKPCKNGKSLNKFNGNTNF